MKIQELIALQEGKAKLTKEERIFQKACAEKAAKMLGVPSVRTVWYDTDGELWKKLNKIDKDNWPASDRFKSDSISVLDLFDNPKVFSDDGEETFTLFDLDTKFVKGEYNDYGGGDDPHYYVPSNVNDVK